LKQPGKIVVWPANIDRGKTRKQGRKLSKSLSTDSPRLAEIEAALKSIPLTFQSKPSSPRPGMWWEKTGYLLVDKGVLSRTDVLKAIAKYVAKSKLGKKTD